jgi:hypothetical protein
VSVIVRPPEQPCQLEGGSGGEQQQRGSRTRQMDKAVSKKLLLVAQFFGLQASSRTNLGKIELFIQHIVFP